jgi:hypothetical protein
MKPKPYTAILLFISAYSPLFIMVLVKDFDFKTAETFKHPILDWSSLGVIFLSIIILLATMGSMRPGNMPVKIISVKNRSTDIIAYTIPYMLAFIGVDLSKPEDVISLCIFLLILLALTIKSNTLFINPILTIAGYGYFDLEYQYNGSVHSTIVISKFDLKKGESYFIRKLTRFLYFVVKPVIKHP